jgi:hypothetical protein
VSLGVRGLRPAVTAYSRAALAAVGSDPFAIFLAKLAANTLFLLLTELLLAYRVTQTQVLRINPRRDLQRISMQSP